MYDAIRQTIELAEKDKETDERVVCVILTDGMENSSVNTTKEDVQRMIGERQNTYTWAFLYIGVRHDQWLNKFNTGDKTALAYNQDNIQGNFVQLNYALNDGRLWTSPEPEQTTDGNDPTEQVDIVKPERWFEKLGNSFKNFGFIFRI